MSGDGFRVPAWHAQHPGRSERYPLCGTVNLDGRVTHRVSATMVPTCMKCRKSLEKRGELGNSPMQPHAFGLM